MSGLHIGKTVYKVSDFLSWQKSGLLQLSPRFQRRPVWPHKAKSLLVDSVVRGIPMPIIFIREQTDLKTLVAIREVVDGQQRLRTLLGFVEPKSLPDFRPDTDAFTVIRTHNRDIAGLTFQQLPPETRQLILDYDFSVHVLPSSTEDRAVLQIFARMNATGVKLNAQEIRNAEFYGPFKKTAYDLAYEQLTRWRKWRLFSETDIARMLEVEETSDIMLTMLSGLHAKRQPLIDTAYRIHDDEFRPEGEVRRRFQHVMDALEDHHDSYLPRSPFRGRALFNTLFTFYYDQMYGLGSEFSRARPKRLTEGLKVAIERAGQRLETGRIPDDLLAVLRGASGDLRARKVRLEFLTRSYQRAQA